MRPSTSVLAPVAVVLLANSAVAFVQGACLVPRRVFKMRRFFMMRALLPCRRMLFGPTFPPPGPDLSRAGVLKTLLDLGRHRSREAASFSRRSSQKCVFVSLLLSSFFHVRGVV